MENHFNLNTAQSNNASIDAEPLRRASTTALLPPDVAASRRSRVNRELISLFQKPKPPSPTAATSAKGIGLYTHIEDPPSGPLFPHQRFTLTEKPMKFLPRGGPHKVQYQRHPRQRLPAEVNVAYEYFRRALDEEELVDKYGAPYDPRERFGALQQPEIVAAPSSLLPTYPTPVLVPSMPKEELIHLRMSLLFTVDSALLSKEHKDKLRSILDKSGWPKRYSSVRGYDLSEAEVDNSWLEEDTAVLMRIQETSNLPFEVIAKTFWPKLTEAEVRDAYAGALIAPYARSYLGRETASKEKGKNERSRDKASTSERRESSEGEARRQSNSGTGDVDVGGTALDPANYTPSAAATSTSRGGQAVHARMYDPTRNAWR